jgi:hypothetical protein
MDMQAHRARWSGHGSIVRSALILQNNNKAKAPGYPLGGGRGKHKHVMRIMTHRS